MNILGNQRSLKVETLRENVKIEFTMPTDHFSLLEIEVEYMKRKRGLDQSVVYCTFVYSGVPAINISYRTYKKCALKGKTVINPNFTRQRTNMNKRQVEIILEVFLIVAIKLPIGKFYNANRTLKSFRNKCEK